MKRKLLILLLTFSCLFTGCSTLGRESKENKENKVAEEESKEDSDFESNLILEDLFDKWYLNYKGELYCLDYYTPEITDFTYTYAKYTQEVSGNTYYVVQLEDNEGDDIFIISENEDNISIARLTWEQFYHAEDENLNWKRSEFKTKTKSVED